MGKTQFGTQLSTKTNVPNQSIKLNERLGFGVGDLSTNLAWGAMSTYIVFFYTDVIGIAAGIIGTIMLFSRFLDGISDIAMGAIVDKTNTKHGKARPWVLWLAIPFAILTVLLFTVPDIAGAGKIVYIAITYNLLVLVFTAVVIPYGTLNTFITRDKKQRSALNVTRMFFATVGLIIVTVFAKPLVNLFGGGQSGWVYAFIVLGGISAILYLITFKTTKERVHPKRQEGKKVSLKESLVAVLKNKYWIILFFVFVVFSVAEQLYQGSAIYIAKYMLGNSTYVSLLSFLIFIPAVIGLLFAEPIYRKFGKAKAMISGSVIFIAGSLIIMIDPTNVMLVAIGSIIRGFGRVPIFGAIWGMLPDTIEYGEWKTGVRNEGVVYSGGSMGQKVGYGVGAALIGWILSWGGYIGGQKIQSDSALFSINSLFIYIPIILYIILIIFLCFYKLDKEYPKIVKELQERDQ